MRAPTPTGTAAMKAGCVFTLSAFQMLGPPWDHPLRVIRTPICLEWVATKHSQQIHGVALCG